MRAMKNSGVPWLGAIPTSWNVSKTKYLYSTHKNIAGARSVDYERLALTMKGVIKRSKTDDAGLQPDNFDTYQILQSGELVFKLIDLKNVSTSRVGLSPYTGLVSPAYIILTPGSDVVPEFGQYYFLSLWHREIFNHLGDEGVRSSLNTQDLLAVPYPILDIAEQRRIVNFLNSKCSKINTFAADIQKEIDILERYKRSVITEAVTKGLDRNVSMRDSGIEWVGRIPTSWTLSKAKYHIVITNGSNPVTEGEIPVYGSGSSSFTTCGEYKNGPAVLLGRKGATLHIPHYIEGKYWNVDTAFDVKVKDGMLLRYYYYLAVCFDYKRYISQTTLPGMTQTNYGNMEIPVPCVEEQSTIINYLDAKCAEIDSIIATKQRQLTVLESYKKSLIYEYVTGKKEVP